MYAAHDAWTCDRVAVKLMHGKAMQRPSASRRFAREVTTLRSISHPNIVACRDAGIHCGRPYCVMDLVEGPSLYAQVKSAGALQPVTALRIIACVARGLEALHAAGVVHRDVKPGNVLLAMNGSSIVGATLADLGLAGVASSHITKSPLTLGTPGYMAPEQALAERADARSDVYALGITAYYTLTGKLPFNGTAEEVIADQVLSLMPAPSRLVPGLTEGIDRIVLCATRKNPDNRYPSMSAFRADLERAAGLRPEAAVGVDPGAGVDTYEPYSDIGRWLMSENVRFAERTLAGSSASEHRRASSPGVVHAPASVRPCEPAAVHSRVA